MSEFLQSALAVVVIVVAAKLAAWMSLRLGQPAVLGKLVAGIVLGPSLLDLLSWPAFAGPHVAVTLNFLAELGVFCLMVLAGLELDVKEAVRAGRASVLAGTLGVVLPVAMGFAAARLLGIGPVEALFVGLTLAATSVSISAQTLIELGQLRTRVGAGVLGAAVFDDALVILLLSVAMAFHGDAPAAGAAGIAWLLGRMLLYGLVAVLAGIFLLPRLLALAARLPVSEPVLTAALMVGLLYAWSAEALGGLAAITGAFLAGVFLARSPHVEPIRSGLMALAFSLLVPVFFVHVGLSANARGMDAGMIVLTVVLCLVAVASKVVGCGGGAWLGGFAPRPALQLGVAMVSRGEVGLIVASLAFTQGLFSPPVFSSVVVVVVVVTLLTPPLLRASFRRPPAAVSEPA